MRFGAGMCQKSGEIAVADNKRLPYIRPNGSTEGTSHTGNGTMAGNTSHKADAHRGGRVGRVYDRVSVCGKATADRGANGNNRARKDAAER